MPLYGVGDAVNVRRKNNALGQVFPAVVVAVETSILKRNQHFNVCMAEYSIALWCMWDCITCCKCRPEVRQAGGV